MVGEPDEEEAIFIASGPPADRQFTIDGVSDRR